MNQEIRNCVMQKMSPFLDNGQTLRLERILEEVQHKQENGNDYEEENFRVSLLGSKMRITYIRAHLEEFIRLKLQYLYLCHHR